MRRLYPDAGPDEADLIVALGGDGFMLQTLHAFLRKGKPIYGMHLGSVGFLMNEYREAGLQQRLEQGEAAGVDPPRKWAHAGGEKTGALGLHEGSPVRPTRQGAQKPHPPDQENPT